MRSIVIILAAAIFTGCTTTKTATGPSTTNLAAGAVPTASSTQTKWEGEGPATNLVDGDMKSRWSSVFADASVKNPDHAKDNQQHVILDLGKKQSLYEVRVHWEAATASAYTVQLSNDGENWRPINSCVESDQGPRTDTLSLKGETGRYLKLAFTARATKYGYSIYEIEVH